MNLLTFSLMLTPEESDFLYELYKDETEEDEPDEPEEFDDESN
jgi:hypothetical protein